MLPSWDPTWFEALSNIQGGGETNAVWARQSIAHWLWRGSKPFAFHCHGLHFHHSEFLQADMLCWGQSTRYFCLLKCSVCQIRRLRSHKFLPCHSQETWQTKSCPLISHCLQFMICMMCVIKRSPLITATATDKPLWEANKASLSVVRSWGILNVASLCCHYDTLREMKRSIVVHDAHWLFLSLPDTLRFSRSGYYRADIV